MVGCSTQSTLWWGVRHRVPRGGVFDTEYLMVGCSTQSTLWWGVRHRVPRGGVFNTEYLVMGCSWWSVHGGVFNT